jgi:hypothetical protein
MHILGTLGALALGSLSLGAAPLAPNSTLINSGYPPVRYQGEAAAVVLFLDDVSIACGKAAPGYVILACASGQTIAMPNPCKPEYYGQSYARLMCHEKAHLGADGWPRTHGD